MDTTADACFWDRIARKYALDATKDMARHERIAAQARD